MPFNHFTPSLFFRIYILSTSRGAASFPPILSTSCICEEDFLLSLSFGTLLRLSFLLYHHTHFYISLCISHFLSLKKIISQVQPSHGSYSSPSQDILPTPLHPPLPSRPLLLDPSPRRCPQCLRLPRPRHGPLSHLPRNAPVALRD